MVALGFSAQAESSGSLLSVWLLAHPLPSRELQHVMKMAPSLGRNSTQPLTAGSAVLSKNGPDASAIPATTLSLWLGNNRRASYHPHPIHPTIVMCALSDGPPFVRRGRDALGPFIAPDYWTVYRETPLEWLEAKAYRHAGKLWKYFILIAIGPNVGYGGLGSGSDIR